MKSNSDSHTSRRLSITLDVSLALSALVILVGRALPTGHLWSIHALGYLRAPSTVLAAGFVIAGFLLARRGRYGEGHRLHLSPARIATLSLCLSVSLLIAAQVAGPSTQLLGDGQLIAFDFDLTLAGNEEIVVHSFESIARSDHIAPLTSALHLSTVHVGRSLARAEAADSLAGASLAAGILFAVALAVGVGRSRLPVWDGLLVGGLLLFSPAVILFLGYVENYTYAQLALGMYVALGMTHVAGRVGIVAPATVLIVATLLHVQALVWWPSLALLWLSRRRPLPTGLGWWITLGLAAVALVLCAFESSAYLLPLVGEGYTLASPAHLLDVVNALWLVFPLLLFALVVMVLGRTISPPEPSSPWGRAQLFADVLLGPGLVYLLVMDPELGMARDWDRSAFLLFAWTAQLMVGVGRLRRQGVIDPSCLARWTTAGLSVAFVATASWLAVHHSTAATLQRLETILNADAHAQEHGFEALARFASDRERWSEAATWGERAYDASGNPRLAALAAAHLRRAGSQDQAHRLLVRALQARPSSHRLRYDLLRATAARQNWEQTLHLASEGERYHPERAVYPFYAADALLRLGRPEEAQGAFRRSLRTGSLPGGAREHAERSLRRIEESLR